MPHVCIPAAAPFVADGVLWQLVPRQHLTTRDKGGNGPLWAATGARLP